MADSLVGPALSINGLDVLILDGTWVRKANDYLGARVRTAAFNRSISTERDPVRIFECQVDLYDLTEETALRTACPRGQPIAVAGYLLPESFDALVDVGDTATVTADIDGVLTILRTATLRIEEWQAGTGL